MKLQCSPERTARREPVSDGVYVWNGSGLRCGFRYRGTQCARDDGHMGAHEAPPHGWGQVLSWSELFGQFESELMLNAPEGIRKDLIHEFVGFVREAGGEPFDDDYPFLWCHEDSSEYPNLPVWKTRNIEPYRAAMKKFAELVRLTALELKVLGMEWENEPRTGRARRERAAGGEDPGAVA